MSLSNRRGNAGLSQLVLIAALGLALLMPFGALGRIVGRLVSGHQQARIFAARFSEGSPRLANRSDAATGTLVRHALVPLAREVSDWTRHAFAEAVRLDPDSLPTGLRYVDELGDLAGGEAQTQKWAATLRAIESSRLDRRANALRQMKGRRYTTLDVSDIDASLRSGARVDLPLLEGASSIGSESGRRLLESIAGPNRMLAHPLEGAMRGEVVGAIPAWMASSERTFYVPIGERVAQIKTDMSFHTSSGFGRPMDLATAEHALLTNEIFEEFFLHYGHKRPMVDFAREPSALISFDDDFGALLRLSGDGGRLYAPRVFSWVDPDPDYDGSTLLSAYANRLQGSEHQRVKRAYEKVIEPALISGLTVSVDMAGYTGTHQQNLGMLLGLDGFPLARAEVADLNDMTLLPGAAMRDFEPKRSAKLQSELANYAKQPYMRADGRIAYRNGRGEEVVDWSPLKPFSRWVANDVMAVLLGELNHAVPGHTRWLREKTKNAFFGALERRRPIIEAYHNGKPGSADAAFLDLLNHRERSRHWKSLREQMFRHLLD